MKGKSKADDPLLRELEACRAKLKRLEKLRSEHERVEAELRKSEERFHRVFDYSNDAIFVLDPHQDKIIDVNPRACTLLGYSRQELLSSSVTRIHPREMPKMLAFAQTVFKDGRGWTDELSCVTKSGGALPAEISASVIDIDGRECMIALVRDISERKQAERKLQESEERFRLLFENAGDAFFLIAPKGQIVDVNQQACKVLQFSRQELKEKFVWDISIGLSRDKYFKMIQRMNSDDPVTMQGIHKRKDGSTFPVEVRICLFESGGQKLRLALARDISERIQAEKAIRESEERLSRILESALDAIITIDKDLQVVLFNQSAEKVLQCTASECIGKSLQRFLTDKFYQLLMQYVTESAGRESTKQYMWAQEGLSARRSDGQEFAIEATFSQVTVAGEPLFTIILRDIEERKKAEAALNKLQMQNIYLQEEIKSQFNFGEIVGASRAIKQVYEYIEKVAATNTTVLLLGETGTGKELIARAIHRLSGLKDNVLIKVNCAALPSGLVESELFGHEKGAFTGATAMKKGKFELADGGTIFLDEIGELPLETQIKLLRILQEQEFERVGGEQTLKVDVRVIAATNRDLQDAVNIGSFRADLFYRLNIFPIRIPPLRERKDDIALLSSYFVGKYSQRMGKRISSFSPEAMDLLMNYDWPGNVRELANILERAVILCEAGVLQKEHIAISSPTQLLESEILTLEQVERQHILKTLQKTGGVIGGPDGAANLLDINRTTLLSRMKKLGIDKTATESHQN
ncbi:MAG: sigma 54-interacting transcriptional regulator [bacterium]